MSLSGEKIRKLLDTKRHRRTATGHRCDQENLSRPEDDSQDDVIDDDAKEKNKEYIDCFVIASKQRLNDEKWIKAYTSETRIEASVDADATTYTACVTQDLAFKRLHYQQLPSGVRTPQETNEYVYIFDQSLTDVTFKEVGPSEEKNQSRRRKRTKDFLIFNDLPETPPFLQQAPPLPPKPGTTTLSFEPPKFRTKKINTERFRETPRLPPPNPPLSVPPRKNRLRLKMEPTPAQLALLDSKPFTADIVQSIHLPLNYSDPADSLSLDDPVSQVNGKKSDDEGNHYESVESGSPVTDGPMKKF